MQRYVPLVIFCCFLSPCAATVFEAIVSPDQDSVVTLVLDKDLDTETTSIDGITISHRFFDQDHLAQESLSIRDINVEPRRIRIKVVGSFAESGVFLISHEPGKWRHSDGSTVGAFSLVIRNRTGIIEDWDPVGNRRWVGPNLWANRLQDWEIVNSVLECGIRPGDFPMPIRTVHAITREISTKSGDRFHLAVEVRGAVSGLQEAHSMAGFLIGAGRGWSDYRAGAIVQGYSGLGGGLLCVVDYAAEQFTFRDHNDETGVDAYPILPGIEIIEAETVLSRSSGNILVEFSAAKDSSDLYTLTLSGWEKETGTFLGGAVMRNRSEKDITGSFAIIAHPGKAGFREPPSFSDFRCWGSMLDYHPEREFGPIVGTLYSLNKGVMKMTVQFMPVAWPGHYSDRFPLPLVTDLEYREKGVSAWQTAGKVRITQPEYLAHFRVENWHSSRDYEYRVVFEDKLVKRHFYSGTIRKDPVDEPEVSFVALTGMGVMGRRADSETPGEGAEKVDGPLTGRWTPANLWFPHREVVSNITAQDPDIIFFTGDQVYENNPTRPDRRDRFPVLDYLYKWYLWHWSFREVTKDRPVICQTDDHDVYQGNIWGDGGTLNLTGLNSDGGGYMMDPLFVQIVERTQCMHNPDSYGFRERMRNSFSSYFGGLTYGGISFAVLEDRKFKTPPPSDSYVPEDGDLVGEVQLRFLEEWLEDWSHAFVKIVISQTTYASTHTTGQVYWDEGLKDYDTGGYPKEGRDRALEMFRRVGALIVCGDQHLATVTRMGIEKPGDAAVQFSVPAVGNIYWRWFFPDVSGDYLDEFGNHFRIIAVANPDNPDVIQLGRSKAWAPRTHDLILKRVSQGDGYGRVVVNKARRTITFECYPFDANLEDGPKTQFKGWPYTVSFDDLDARTPVGYLPDLHFQGTSTPVIHVINEKNKETVYVIRMWDKTYSPPVFEHSVYSVHVLDPDYPEKEKVIKGMRPSGRPGKKKVRIRF